MTKEKHQCQGRVEEGVFHSHQCSRNGSFFEDDKYWCKTHAPSQIKLRDEKQRQRHKEERDADFARLRQRGIQALVESAEILHRQFGTDIVLLRTSLPSPFPPDVDKTPLHLKFEVRRGHAKAYVVEHFPGIPIKEIDG